MEAEDIYLLNNIITLHTVLRKRDIWHVAVHRKEGFAEAGGGRERERERD